MDKKEEKRKKGKAEAAKPASTPEPSSFKGEEAEKETRKREEGTRMKDFPPLTKYGENPIILPREGSWWECRQTFNPGAILLEGKVHLLYRAIGDDGISRIGYAASEGGFGVEERLDYPVYQHPVAPSEFTVYSYASGGGFGGVEDPRIVRVDGEQVLYMTYTACSEGLRVGLTSISIESFLSKRWDWTTPRLISPPGEVHKNWVIFPEKIHSKYAILHSLSPQILISYLDSLDFKPGSYLTSYHDGGNGTGKKDFWDSVIRGAGAPSIKTELGWLLFYHAIDLREPNKYKIGAILLDLEDPRRVICCSAAPVLEPDMVYENSGFKPGVVYLSGAVVKDGVLLVYYGASDNYVCVASCGLEEFLRTLMEGGRGVFIETQETQVLPSPRQKKQRVSRRRRYTSSVRKNKGEKKDEEKLL